MRTPRPEQAIEPQPTGEVPAGQVELSTEPGERVRNGKEEGTDDDRPEGDALPSGSFRPMTEIGEATEVQEMSDAADRPER